MTMYGSDYRCLLVYLSCMTVNLWELNVNVLNAFGLLILNESGRTCHSLYVFFFIFCPFWISIAIFE